MADLDPGLYHEFECEVEDEETEGIIKPQEHWNAPHKPVKLLGYELVEEKNCEPGTTSYTFTGLNGNIDKEYLIETDLLISSGGVSRKISLLINGSSSNFAETTHVASDSAASFENNSIIMLGRSGFNLDCYTWNEHTIKAVSGSIRRINGDYHFVSTNLSKRYVSKGTGYWNDTSSNITSIGCEIDGGSFSGNIRLWKKLPLNIEG